MKINLVIFLSSASITMLKTIESICRPFQGDIIDDPGFDQRFHNGYEVVKVTINYDANECFVSLHPLVLDLEEMKVEDYIEKLKNNGWRVISKEELSI
jgi:hypothetical protein